MKKIFPLLLIVTMPMLSGCDMLGGLMSLGCGFSDDSSHCYQASAIQSGDPEKCEKIQQVEQFKSLGSNPPKDKCYYTVAQNANNTQICSNIKGGLMSYSENDCRKDIAVRTEDTAECKLLNNMTECSQGIIDKKINRVQDTLSKNNESTELTQEDMDKINKDMQDLQKMMELMSNLQKNSFDMQMGAVKNLK